MDCVFCGIVNGELPAYRLYEDDKVIVILDKYPLTRGHSLVIPKKHFENILEVDDRTLAHLFKVARIVAIASREALGAEGVNIITNIGRAAGQVIFHAHIHVVPRYKDDGLRITASRKKFSEEEKSEIAVLIGEKIREHLK